MLESEIKSQLLHHDCQNAVFLTHQLIVILAKKSLMFKNSNNELEKIKIKYEIQNLSDFISKTLKNN